MIDAPIAVCSRTFSKHEELRSRLEKKFSNIRYNDAGEKLAGEQLTQFLRGCMGAIVALEPVDKTVLQELPELKVIAKYGVGLDGLDLQALEDFGVQLGWKGGVNRRSVSELALGLMLSLVRKISVHNESVKAGEWSNLHGRQLSDCSVGIIGCGNIGRDLIGLLKPFGCRILVNDLIDLSEFCKAENCDFVSKEQIYEQADVITYHVPLTDETRHCANKNVFEQMKKGALLINTSRGGVVHELDLLEALRDETLGGAALDVFENEPPLNWESFSLPNLIVTPHNGGSSEEGVLAMGQSAVDCLEEHMGHL